MPAEPSRGARRTALVLRVACALALPGLAAPSVAAQAAPPAPPAAPPRDEAARERERDALIERLEAELQGLRARVSELEARDAERARTDVDIADRLSRLAATVPAGTPSGSGGTGPLKDWDFSFGGNVKANFIHDFGPIGSENDFSENTIPVDGTAAAGREGRTKFQARETRLSGTAKRETSLGSLKLYVEGDFAGGDNNSFRLRHAYAEVAGFLAGQTWSTFMDDTAIPDTLDFDGPGAAVLDRRTQARYTAPLGPSSSWSVALEDPTAEFDNPDDLPGVERDPLPDLVARVRGDEGPWHGQAAGVLRELLFDGDPGTPDEQTLGWGVNLTGRYLTGEKSNLAAKLGFGEGIARYFQDLQGQDSDAVLKPDGDLKALPVIGWGAGYQHFWNAMLRSNFIYSTLQVDNDDAQPGDAYHQTQYVAVNLIWSPEPFIDWGVETLWGTRENKDGADGSSSRVQFAFKYKF